MDCFYFIRKGDKKNKLSIDFMKIVNIIGGLGNQMLQYAFALSLKEKFPNEEVLIDTSHFNYIFIKKYKAANLHNGFEIYNIFPNATLKKAKSHHLMKLTWYIPNYLLSRLARKFLPKRKKEIVQKVTEYFAYNPCLFEQEGDFYYEGIWASINHFLPIRDKLLYTFKHPTPNKINADYIAHIQASDSVGIHIRRGDYLYTKSFRNICDLPYYKDAIAEILKDGKQHNFYIFSNDVKWCEDNIVPLVNGNNIVMVRGNYGKMSCWDMFLMTYCKDLIIANSSFSWWGAFLNNQGGRIIAPAKWVNRENVEFDIWSPNWIRK